MRVLNSLSSERSFHSYPSLVTSNQIHLDSLQTNFARQASDLSVLTSMGVSSAAFSLGRTLAHSLFTGLLNRSALSATAWSLAFMAEVTAFRATNRAFHPEAAPCFDLQSFSSTAMDFLMIKGAGTLLGNSPFVIRQSVQALAMVGGEYAAEALRLRENSQKHFSARYANALATTIALEAGGHFSRRIFGGCFETFQRNLELRSETLLASRTPIFKLQTILSLSAERAVTNEELINDGIPAISSLAATGDARALEALTLLSSNHPVHEVREAATSALFDLLPAHPHILPLLCLFSHSLQADSALMERAKNLDIASSAAAIPAHPQVVLAIDAFSRVGNRFTERAAANFDVARLVELAKEKDMASDVAEALIVLTHMKNSTAAEAVKNFDVKLLSDKPEESVAVLRDLYIEGENQSALIALMHRARFSELGAIALGSLVKMEYYSTKLTARLKTGDKIALRALEMLDRSGYEQAGNILRNLMDITAFTQDAQSPEAIIALGRLRRSRNEAAREFLASHNPAMFAERASLYVEADPRWTSLMLSRNSPAVENAHIIYFREKVNETTLFINALYEMAEAGSLSAAEAMKNIPIVIIVPIEKISANVVTAWEQLSEHGNREAWGALSVLSPDHPLALAAIRRLAGTGHADALAWMESRLENTSSEPEN